MMMIVVLIVMLWMDEIVSGGMLAEHAPIRIVWVPATATIEQLRLRVEFSPMEITPIDISTAMMVMMVMMIGNRRGNKRMV